VHLTRLIAAAAAAFSSLIVAGSAGGALVFNASSGIDNATGARLGNTVADPEWTVGTGGAGTAFAGQTLVAKTDLPPTYIPDADSTLSRWISINSGIGIQSTSVPMGTYNFQVTFNMTGFDAATALIPASRSAADDQLAAIRVNGTTVFTRVAPQDTGQENWFTLPANLGAGAFTAGTNTITFQLDNIPPSNTPLALRFEGNVAANPIPEPAGLGLAAAAAAVLLAIRRRRQSVDTITADQ
jgi:hypothetical protein